MNCPRCGSSASRDEADVGVGVIYGPWGCSCGWSESREYNLLDSPREIPGYRVDQWGGATPEVRDDFQEAVRQGRVSQGPDGSLIVDEPDYGVPPQRQTGGKR